MNVDTFCWAALAVMTVRIVQNLSLECYMSAEFKQESAKHRLGQGLVIEVLSHNNASLHADKFYG